MRRCFYHTDLVQNAVFHNFSRQIAFIQYSGPSKHAWTFSETVQKISQITYSSFSHDITTNYAMARAREVGHAGGHSAGPVVSKQRPLGQLLRALCFKYCINGLYLCYKEL